MEEWREQEEKLLENTWKERREETISASHYLYVGKKYTTQK